MTYINIPTELREIVLVSRTDSDKYKVLEGHPDLPAGVYTAQQASDMILAYLNKQAIRKAEADRDWKASTNERRRAEAAERRTFQVSVKGSLYAMKTLLELPDGGEATVMLGGKELKFRRQGASLVYVGDLL